MQFTLQTLEELMPAAVDWCKKQESLILRHGVPLDGWEMQMAAQLGVLQPERLRLLRVPQVPLPNDYLLCAAAQRLGLVSETTLAMTLGYGIFMRDDHWRQREILAHELVHAAQCEQLGGLDVFLPQYLKECFMHGYDAAPLETEAVRRSTEILRGQTP